MINKKFLLIILSSLFLLWNCDECSTCTNPPDEEDKILVNTSFEKNGNPSTDGWMISIALGYFVTDTPTGGGSYSIALEASNPGGEAVITVGALTGFNVYRLNFFAKFENISSSATLSFIRNGTVSKEKNISITNTNWTSYSIKDTFQTNVGDSIRILFRGGIIQLLSGRTYFDLCKLEAVE